MGLQMNLASCRVYSTENIRKYKFVQYELRHEKPAFCICENRGADQLCGNHKAELDHHLCFRFNDSTIALLPISEISSL